MLVTEWHCDIVNRIKGGEKCMREWVTGVSRDRDQLKEVTEYLAVNTNFLMKNNGFEANKTWVRRVDSRLKTKDLVIILLIGPNVNYDSHMLHRVFLGCNILVIGKEGPQTSCGWNITEYAKMNTL